MTTMHFNPNKVSKWNLLYIEFPSFWLFCLNKQYGAMGKTGTRMRILEW